MDVTGLILLLGLLLLGLGLYFAIFKNKIAKKPAFPEKVEVYPTEQAAQQTKQESHRIEQETHQAEKKFIQEKPKVDLPEQPKFETSIEFFPDIVFPPDPVKEHVPDLPWNYNDTNITLMARDPETVYAYWEVSEERKNALKEIHGSRWENSMPVIRVYDVTGIDYFNGNNAISYTDEFINDYADSWYIRIGKPDRTLCADLGRILDNGTFVTIARSNSTQTPRNTVSDKVDSSWMLVTDDQKKLYERIGNTDSISSYELFERD